jgi:WhiB family transcriptional regulator, redox-sensing transcriptional regulator
VALTLLPAETALACATNPDLFFAESPLDVERAKALCQECPVRAACLANAQTRREPWGVWGGELFLDGRVIPGKRARGRPRKSSLTSGFPLRAPYVSRRISIGHVSGQADT